MGESMRTTGFVPGDRPAGAPADLDAINRGTWQRPDTVEVYRKLHGWTDPGEEAAVRWISGEARGQPILDIGVGAGRTTELLRPIAGEYLGVDYTAEMVDACRQAHPGVRFERMDARDLSALPADHFGAVVFSFNGIDSVAPADRHKVLLEVHRVLRAGGRFLVSAHNRHGPGTREKPRVRVPFTGNPLRLCWRLARSVASLPRALRNYLRLRTVNQVHEDWAVMNCGAHDFGLVVVYTSLPAQKRQLEEAGYLVEAVFDNVSGQQVREGTDTSQAWWFHYVARKAPRH